MEIGIHFPSFFVICLNSKTPAECVILVIRLKAHLVVLNVMESWINVPLELSRTRKRGY